MRLQGSSVAFIVLLTGGQVSAAADEDYRWLLPALLGLSKSSLPHLVHELASRLNLRSTAELRQHLTNLGPVQPVHPKNPAYALPRKGPPLLQAAFVRFITPA